LKCYTPQHLADIFQLYFVRKGFLWYGCEAVPQWIEDHWNLNNARVSVILLQRSVLSSSKDRDSLTSPKEVTNEK
jgi:hypothetical protein